MSEQKVYLDDIYASEKCEGSPFKAVVMMSHEARFINEQARQGFIELEKKPTTIAMYKFKEDRLQMFAQDENAPLEQSLGGEPVVDDEMAAEIAQVTEELAEEEALDAADSVVDSEDTPAVSPESESE